MQRYFISFAYDGTNYHGWQIQPNGNTVQEELQKALSLILRCDINVVGAGRTDTGVHARSMVAHFDISTEIAFDAEMLSGKLNRLLPPDIVVFSIKPVAEDMHARFSATWRTYHYYVHKGKDPFVRNYSYSYYRDLDFALMNEAARYLLEVEDFETFCKSHSDAKTTLCNVTEAQWIQDDATHWHFVIKANRFLRNMVRAVVGTLVEVGQHKITVEEFKNIVDQRKRTGAGESMPAHALFLEKVEY